MRTRVGSFSQLLSFHCLICAANIFCPSTLSSILRDARVYDHPPSSLGLGPFFLASCPCIALLMAAPGFLSPPSAQTSEADHGAASEHDAR